MERPVRKAILPAAGRGTRFFPASKAIPKEMITVVDQPMMQYVLDEALDAGIEHCVIVIGPKKSAIENHFSSVTEANRMRGERRPHDAAGEEGLRVRRPMKVSFAWQDVPLGLGHAVWCARDLVGDEPFAVMNPDVVTRGRPGCLAQIMETYDATGANVVSIEECGPGQTMKYGIVELGQPLSDCSFRITSMVEKPPLGSEPSNFKISGRYILAPRIFDFLARQRPGTGGEVQLTDAMLGLAVEQPIFGHCFKGRSFDCGSREGFIAANIFLALNDAELRPIVLDEVDRYFRNEERSSLPGTNFTEQCESSDDRSDV
jgi:UTP--glucose-1-phosphate uridylyltransferase